MFCSLNVLKHFLDDLASERRRRKVAEMMTSPLTFSAHPSLHPITCMRSLTESLELIAHNASHRQMKYDKKRRHSTFGIRLLSILTSFVIIETQDDTHVDYSVTHTHKPIQLKKFIVLFKRNKTNQKTNKISVFFLLSENICSFLLSKFYTKW